MNTHVNFEIAKLLKEKGYDILTEHGYNSNGMYHQDGSHSINYNTTPYLDLFCSAPTIAEVVMWLYEKHGIWISVDPDNDTDTWFYTISHNKSETVFGNYSGPIEAYEKGIEHVLNNLI